MARRKGTSAPIADPDDVDVPPPDQDGHDNLSAAPGPGIVDAPLDATPPAPTFQRRSPSNWTRRLRARSWTSIDELGMDIGRLESHAFILDGMAAVADHEPNESL